NAWQAALLIDPLRAANYLEGVLRYRWRFLSLDGRPVTASNGLSVNVDGAFDAKRRCDWLVVNASWSPERFQARVFQQRLRQVARAGTTLVALDTGAFVLAWAGLLDGHTACVHPEHSDAFRALFPHIDLLDRLYTRSGSRLCCCGGVAAADLALDRVRRDCGAVLAEAAGRYVFHPGARPDNTSQSTELDVAVGENMPAALANAVLLMARNLEEPLPMADIARYAGCSLRQLERLYRRHTGLTPVRYYLHVRLERARALLTQTGRSVADVASECGFSRGDAFARAYRAEYGMSPREARQIGRVPFQLR
ncbi:MAG: GlxA family transcriptional regulator, partial [Pseudomonadota bacterium]